MNTSFLAFVLAGSVLAGQNANLSWQKNYSQAQQASAAQKKPLAVVFGSGPDGWAKLVRDTAPSADVAKLLADKYVCCYVDVSTPAGKKLAQDFGVNQSSGLILSDRTGSLQAFWHQGDLTNQSLVGYLGKYADPAIEVRGTETVNSARTSFYPSNSSPVNWAATSGPDCPT